MLDSAPVSWNPVSSTHLTVQLCRGTPQALYCRWNVKDRREEVMARFTKANDPVYTDSCVEIFLGSRVSSSAYMNVEVGCLGVILLQTNLVPRGGPPSDPARWNSRISRWTSIDHDSLRASGAPAALEWSASIRIPFELIDELLEQRVRDGPKGASAPPGLGENERPIGLFKCADDAPRPHWGSWADIGDELNFHQPARFGTLVYVRGQPARSAKKRARL